VKKKIVFFLVLGLLLFGKTIMKAEIGDNLDVDGLRVDSTDKVIVESTITIAGNVTVGTYILVTGTAGISGQADITTMTVHKIVFPDSSYQITSATVTSATGGDDLGNHIATTTLDMDNFDITTGVNITATGTITGRSLVISSAAYIADLYVDTLTVIMANGAYNVSTQFDTIATDTNTLNTVDIAIGVTTGTIRTDLDAVKLDTGTLRTDLTAVEVSTGELNTRVYDSTTTIWSEVNNLKLATGTNRTSITALEVSTAPIDTLRVDTGTIRTDLDAVKLDTGTMRTDVDALMLDTGTLVTADLAIGVDTGTIRTDLDQVKLDTATLESVDLAIGVTTSTLEASITDLEASTGAITATILGGHGYGYFIDTATVQTADGDKTLSGSLAVTTITVSGHLDIGSCESIDNGINFGDEDRNIAWTPIENKITISTGLYVQGDFDVSGSCYLPTISTATITGYLGIPFRTKAELSAYTPTVIGEIYYLTDGENSVNAVVSTGAVKSGFDSFGIKGTSWEY